MASCIRDIVVLHEYTILLLCYSNFLEYFSTFVAGVNLKRWNIYDIIGFTKILYVLVWSIRMSECNVLHHEKLFIVILFTALDLKYFRWIESAK